MNCPRCNHETSQVSAGRFCSWCGWLENDGRELLKQATAEMYMMAIDLHNDAINKLDELLEKCDE